MNKKNLHKLLENLATGNTDAAAKNLSKELRKISMCYRDWETDRKSTRLNSSHSAKSRMPSSA